MTKLFHKIRKHSTRFKNELRKQIRVAVVAAIGFLIAYAWREYVLGLANDLFSDIQLNMPNMSNFLAAFFLTLIGVILILISSKLLE